MATRRLGMRLKRMRREAQMTRHALAKRAGVTHNHIKKIEEGISSPTVAMLEKLAKALGVTVVDLVKR
jgi:transcriptional regulator with XRE-family HTH domain